MNLLTRGAFLAVVLSNSLSGEPIFSAGDFILGGARIGNQFEVGTAGFAGGSNNWPGAEPPSDLINGMIGGGGEKYLNFIRLDAGFIITPSYGPSVVSSMELWVANDAVERDPASFEVWGANSGIAGNGPFEMSQFTLISEGLLDLPANRDTVNDQSGFSQTVVIGDGQFYASYLVLFPTTKGAGNSMQLSEIQFDGDDSPSLSPIAITSVSHVAGSDEVTLTWSSQEGASYSVHLSEDLTNWDTKFANGLVAGGGNSTTMTLNLADAGVTDLATLFFRIAAD